MTIDFSCGDTYGVIVEESTGVRFSTQTGGIACGHPDVEGFFMPINLHWFDNYRHDDNLLDVWGETNPASEFHEPYDRERIQKYLDRSPELSELLEPRESYEGEWGEAWVPVRIKATDSFDPFHNLEGKLGILIYPNSD